MLNGLAFTPILLTSPLHTFPLASSGKTSLTLSTTPTVVDLTPFYPEAVRPAFTVAIRDFYIATYRDRFFTHPPAWFQVYMLLEAVYHIPASLWMLGALVRGESR